MFDTFRQTKNSIRVGARMELCENPVRINRPYTLLNISSIPRRTGFRNINPEFVFKKSKNVDRIVRIAESRYALMDNDSNDSTHIEFVTFITLKDGRRIYAREYGKKAFPIRVPNKKDN